jgi:hypothetical protein
MAVILFILAPIILIATISLYAWVMYNWLTTGTSMDASLSVLAGWVTSWPVWDYGWGLAVVPLAVMIILGIADGIRDAWLKIDL